MTDHPTAPSTPPTPGTERQQARAQHAALTTGRIRNAQQRRVRDLYAALLKDDLTPDSVIRWTEQSAAGTFTTTLNRDQTVRVHTTEDHAETVPAQVPGTRRTFSVPTVTDVSDLEDPRPEMILTLDFPHDPAVNRAQRRWTTLTRTQIRLLWLLLRERPVPGRTLQVTLSEPHPVYGDRSETRFTRYADENDVQVLTTVRSPAGQYRDGLQGWLTAPHDRTLSRVQDALNAGANPPDAAQTALHHDLAALMHEIAGRHTPDSLVITVLQAHGSCLICSGGRVTHHAATAGQQLNAEATGRNWLDTLTGVQTRKPLRTRPPAGQLTEQDPLAHHAVLSTRDGDLALHADLCLILLTLMQAWQAGSTATLTWTNVTHRVTFVPVWPHGVVTQVETGHFAPDQTTFTAAQGLTRVRAWNPLETQPETTALIGLNSTLPLLMRLNRRYLQSGLGRDQTAQETA